MNHVLAHFIGDYLLQSHNVAINKTKNTLLCLVHCILYVLPFLLITHNWKALLIIGASHFVIDRFRIAAYVNVVKNILLSFNFKHMPKWNKYGFPVETPEHVSFWLLIITDNIIHIIINGLTLSKIT